MKPWPCLLSALALSAAAFGADRSGDAVVLIGHSTLPPLDVPTVQRLYTGRAIQVSGIAVTVVNTAQGSRSRERFMASVMQQSDDQYIAYWTVRRHIGRGVPPGELKNAIDVIAFVQTTPGAVGYVSADDLRPGLNVLLRP